MSNKSKFKNKNKMYLAVNKKSKKKKYYVLDKRNWMKSSIFWLNKQISYLMKKWEKNCKKPVRKKSSRKNWNFWKKPYQLIQFLNSIYLLTKWPTHASTSVRNRSMQFWKRNLESNKKQKSKNKERWRRTKEEIKKRKKFKKLSQ